MPILTSEDGFWNSKNNNIFEVPLIIVDGAACLYCLVRDLHEGLESFLRTGKTEDTEFHVFPEEEESAMASRWEGLGLTVTYHSQQFWYMSRRFTVTYPKANCPETGVSMSLIPWFMIPDRPYPVFVYIYAIRHYQASEKKSLSRSAAAAAKVFGIKGFNKSTVSRSIRAFANFVDATRIDRPLSVEGRGASAEPAIAADGGDDAPKADVSELIRSIPEILKRCPTIGALEEEYGAMARRLPVPAARNEAATRALDGMPGSGIEVIKASAPSSVGPKDARARPGRPRGKRGKHVQRTFGFVDSREIERIRKRFIEACRHLAIDAATAYHRFLV